MNEKYLYSLIAVVALFLMAYVGVEAAGLHYLFGVIIPYLAIITFIVGFATRVMEWASSPVPFRIPSTCGQQKSLPWIKHSKVDNPFTAGGVIVRMIMEILLFRSLFRNTKCKLNEGPRISYVWEKWLWLFSLAFHYAFFTTLVRHLRFFLEPVPSWLQILEKVDGFLQIGLPGVMISGVVLLAAVVFLLLRRILISQVRYFSLAADFFPLFLIIGIAVSGIMMRYFTKVNIVGVKEATGDLSRVSVIRDLCGDDFAIYTGDDASSCEFCLLGGNGTITVSGNVAPRLVHEMITAAINGDRETSTSIDANLTGLHTQLSIQSNPIPVKWAVAEMGLMGKGIRLPLTWLTEDCFDEARTAMQQARVL